MTSRALKRRRTEGTKAYHDRIELPDDFEVVHSRETLVRQRTGLPVDTPRSPQKGRTTWTSGDSWAPEENLEFALDPDGEWYDEQVEAPVAEAIKVRPKLKTKKSKVSVSPSVYPFT